MSRPMPRARAGSVDPGRASANPAPHTRAVDSRHRSASAPWVFVLETRAGQRTAWRWARSGLAGESARARFFTFNECVADARRHGFDFQQPYHVTAVS